MAKIKIDKSKCKGCYLCIVNCPNGLIKILPEINAKGVKPVSFGGGKPARRSLGEGGCTGCAMCALICPDGVIRVEL